MSEPVLAYEHELDAFLRIIQDAETAIARQVIAALTSQDLTRRRLRLAQLEQVQALLEDLGARVDPAARKLIADAHGQSAALTVTRIEALDILAPQITSFAGISRESVRALQDAMVGRLQAARVQVGRQVEDVYAKAGRRAALRAIVGADGSPRTAAQQLARDLMQKREVQTLLGETGAGFIDDAGRRWQLSTYSRMVTRTVTREAVVEGALNRMAAHGIALARVSEHASSCPQCSPYQGRLVSLDGQTVDYLGEAVMGTEFLPPFHPNCRHSIAPVAVTIDMIRQQMAA
jgi:hypothetical protein